MHCPTPDCNRACISDFTGQPNLFREDLPGLRHALGAGNYLRTPTASIVCPLLNPLKIYDCANIDYRRFQFSHR